MLLKLKSNTATFNEKTQASSIQPKTSAFSKPPDSAEELEHSSKLSKLVQTSPASKPDEVRISKLRLKFLQAVPAFIGKQLESYGPFSADQEAEIPEELAKLLIRQGKAKQAG